MTADALSREFVVQKTLNKFDQGEGSLTTKWFKLFSPDGEDPSSICSPTDTTRNVSFIVSGERIRMRLWEMRSACHGGIYGHTHILQNN